jgi:hypothetical protein
MPRPKDKVTSALVSKGFVPRGAHHVMLVYYTTTGQKTRACTKTSHTPKMKDITDGLLAQMAKQCRLSTREFLGLVDCQVSRTAFEELLRERGEI